MFCSNCGAKLEDGVKFCPECGKPLLKRKSRYGTFFWGCSKYPDCSFVLWAEPNGEKCPQCGSLLVKKYLKQLIGFSI